MYIVFEGVAGSGKSTQSKKLHNYLKELLPEQEITWTREPGGTEISETIRTAVQGTVYEEKMHPITDAYLYASSRAQALRSIVEPVLNNGGIVISDRSFVTSLAIQGHAQGHGIDRVLKINESAIEGFTPDYVFLVDINTETAKQRQFDGDGDKWEKMNLDFHLNVNEGYKKVATLPMFQGKWITIDGNKTENEVFEEIKRIIQKILQ